MVDQLSFEEPLRRAVDAHTRYVEALSRVTQEYWQSIFGIFRESPVKLGGLTLFPSSSTSTAGSRGAPPANAPVSSATLVLEADLESEAQAAFLVENNLSRTVSTAVIPSAFADPSGRALAPKLRIVPATVTLEPGGRTLVQLFATVTSEMEPDVAYRGSVAVPGLAEHGIPVLLRRRAANTERATPAESRPRAPKKSRRKRASPSRRRPKE